MEHFEKILAASIEKVFLRRRPLRSRWRELNVSVTFDKHYFLRSLACPQPICFHKWPDKCLQAPSSPAGAINSAAISIKRQISAVSESKDDGTGFRSKDHQVGNMTYSNVYRSRTR